MGKVGILMGENDEIHEEIDFGVDWDHVFSILIGNAPFGGRKKGAIPG